MWQYVNISKDSQTTKNNELDCNYLDFLVLGVIFILYSTWWTIQIARVYYFMRWKHVEFRSSLIYPCSNRGWKQSVQSGIQLCIMLCGIAVIMNSRRTLEYKEDNDDSINSYGDSKSNMLILRASIILASFSFSCLVNIGSQLFAHSFPPGLDYCIFIFAFVVEAILFGHYVMDEEETFTSIAENLVTYCAILTVIITILEFHYRNQVIFPFLRTFVTFVQGTWLCHIGFILCSSLQWEINEDNISIMSMYFAAHCMSNFIITSIIWQITYKLALSDQCCCLPVSLDKSNEVFLENRVHFDYHILDRLGSDVD